MPFNIIAYLEHESFNISLMISFKSVMYPSNKSLIFLVIYSFGLLYSFGFVVNDSLALGNFVAFYLTYHFILR